jgi:hypothetical protein
MTNSTKEQVESFLNDFHTKFRIFNIIFLNRNKNIQALFDLEITAEDRLEFIKNLKPENYFNGPNLDAYDPDSPPNWEFGMIIKDYEVYIKINTGKPNKSVMCISFHIAEQEIIYPFK